MLKLIKISVACFYTLITISSVFAAGEAVRLDSFPSKRLNNLASLQNGAKLYMNYCVGCHSISQVRYSRLTDLGIKSDQIKKFLLLTDGASLSNTVISSMKKEDAKNWFGKAPPDLSLTARSRSSPNGPGSDWIYTYLRGYYKDESQPTGWNNTVYPGVGMPNVLWELQGINKAVYTEKMENGTMVSSFDKFVIEEPGRMSRVEFDENIADLTAFLVWVAEPVGQFRKQLGVWALLFLGLFAFVAWRLNAAYWKDIK